MFLKRTERIVQFVVSLLLVIGCWESAFSQFGYKKIDDDPFSEYKTFEFWTRPHYNRVEGLFLHGGLIFNLPETWNAAAILQAGYGLKNEQERYEVGLEKRFGDQDRLIMRALVFDKTFTNDGWKVGELENSLAGLFLREDFRNYFGREGWKVLVDKRMWQQHLFRIEYAQNDYTSMETNSNFAGSFFGTRKKYRANPGIDKGRENSLKLSFMLDWRDNPFFPLSGVCFEGIYENTSGDFNTNGFFLDTRYYQPTVGNQRIIFKSLLGFREGSLAPQYLMNIGGPGSLRGYRDFVKSGQNQILFSVDYAFGGDILQKLPIQQLPLMDAASLSLFIDAGDAWANSKVKDNLFGDLSGAEFLVDGGFSFLLLDGFFRIDFARQFSGNDKEWRISLRLFNKY